MVESTKTKRHVTILRPETTVLLIIDIQEKLVPAIHEGPRVIEETVRLINGCKALDVPVIATEQYPKGLGPLVSGVRDVLEPDAIFEKSDFSGCGCSEAMRALEEMGRYQVLLAGIEAHVCMVQTALDLLVHEYQVHVPVETTSSRRPESCAVAIERMHSAGAIVTTLESALFEMLVRAGTPQFKEILKIIK